MGFGLDHLRLKVYCKETPGVVVYTDPAAENKGDLDSLPDGNYGSRTLEENVRHHYSDLKDAQLSTLNSHKKQKAV